MDNTSYIPPTAPPEEQKSPSQLGDIIGKLTSDPELMGRIFSVLGKESSSEQKKEESAPVSAPAEAPLTASDDISSKLPEIMATLAPMLSGGGASKMPEGLSKISKRDDKRTCLLRAIKPYVSRGRGEAIDYMIRIAGVTEILKQIN